MPVQMTHCANEKQLLMLRAIHQYCNDAATSDATILQTIKYEEHQYGMSSQTVQIDKRFRELCREPFSHLVDHHGDFGQYKSRMLQHLVFRYTRRTAGSDSKLVLVGHRIGMSTFASRRSLTNCAGRSYSERG